MAPGTSVGPTVQRERGAAKEVRLVDPVAVPMSVEGRPLGSGVGGAPGLVGSGKPHSAVGQQAEQVAIVNTVGEFLPVKRKRGRPRKDESRTPRKNPLPEGVAPTAICPSAEAPPSKGGIDLSENLDVSPSAKRPRVAQETEPPPPAVASLQVRQLFTLCFLFC